MLTGFTYQIPAKTFLVGEYLALQTGQGLIVNTYPGFECGGGLSSADTLGVDKKFLLKDMSLLAPPWCLSSLQSPAGVLWEQFLKPTLTLFLQNNMGASVVAPHWKFVNHLQLGGFGASTAEFLALLAWFKSTESWSLLEELYLPSGHNPLDTDKNIFLQNLLKLYRRCAWNGQGFAPSGLDVMAQCLRQICLFQQFNFQKSFEWPFENIDLWICPTGYKVATHEHLQASFHFSVEDLQKHFVLAVAAFEAKNEDLFVKSIQSYQHTLIDLGLTCLPTQEKLQFFLAKEGAQAGVLAAKGCGALGADVIALLVEKNKKQQFEEFLKKESVAVVARVSHASSLDGRERQAVPQQSLYDQLFFN